MPGLYGSDRAVVKRAGAQSHSLLQCGRGGSERPQRVEDYALSNIVADVAGIMDALGVERAHIVGHDWGAAVCENATSRLLI